MAATAKAAAPPIGGRAGDYELIRRSIAFLGRVRPRQPGPADLARHLRLADSECRALFRRWCGLSADEFREALTVDHARALLTGSAGALEAPLALLPGRPHDRPVTLAAITSNTDARRGDGLAMAYGFHGSPFGEALLIASAGGVAGLAFVNDDIGQTRAETLADMMQRWPRATYVQAPERTLRHAATIFAAGGRRRVVRLVLIGAEFDVRVWQALLRIPVGRAVSYTDIARHIGAPAAARAVGSAVGRNPVSFVVPGHRVLRTDGGLGGYRWGITRKRALIGWEYGRLRARG
jgi:AraC family transcriptional regulator of adaptative response/methylated-DNA-[protein]-cysteine methyltransferase